MSKLSRATSGDALGFPEVETTWAESDKVGNSLRSAQRGGPLSLLADPDEERRPWFRSVDGITSEIDVENDRVWLTKQVATIGGFNLPAFIGARTMAADLLGVAAAQYMPMYDSASTEVAIGVPLASAGLRKDADRDVFRTSWLLQLLGMDDRAWAAAARVTQGDLTAVDELPPEVVVRGRSTRSVHVPDESVNLSRILEGVGPIGSALSRAGHGVEVKRTGRGTDGAWVAQVRVTRDNQGSLSAVVPEKYLKLLAKASAGASDEITDVITLMAPAGDEQAVSVLSAVVAAAHGGHGDPVRVVPGADRLVQRTTHTEGATEEEAAAFLLEKFRFNRTSQEGWTKEEDEGQMSASGHSAGRYDLDLKIGHDLVGALFHDIDVNLAAAGGETSWRAVREKSAFIVAGGRKSKGFGTGVDRTSVRLDSADLRALCDLAESRSDWQHCCNDLNVMPAWRALRASLRSPTVDSGLAHKDPSLAVTAAHNAAVSHFVAQGSDTTDVLRTALGRDEAVVTSNVLGVLECWPPGTESVRFRYEQLGAWMEALREGEWGSRDGARLLRSLEALGDVVERCVRMMTRIPARARLEMLGQVLQWQDQIDVAWGEIGAPIDASGAASRHRPTSVVRAEELATQCRTEASPHLTSCRSMLGSDTAPSAAQVASFAELAGILPVWRQAAAALRRVYRDSGTSEADWRVRPSTETARRPLDPELTHWRPMVDHMIKHDHRVPESWIALV